MKTKTDNFIDILNKSFGPPFLPQGFFRAKSRPKNHGKGLQIHIGDRDIEIDGKGKLVGAGTNVNIGKLWNIKPIEWEN